METTSIRAVRSMPSSVKKLHHPRGDRDGSLSPRALSKFIAIPLSCRSLPNVEMRRCFWQPLMPTEAMNSGFLSGSVAWGCQRSLTCRHLLTRAFFPLLAYELMRMLDGMSTTVTVASGGLRFVLKRMRTMWRWP